MDRLPHLSRAALPNLTTVVNVKAYFSEQLAAWQYGAPPPPYVPSAPGQHSIIHEAIQPATETPEVASLREQFAELVGMGGDEQLDRLADMVSKATLEGKEVTDEVRQALKGQFKEALRRTLHTYEGEESLLPSEKAILSAFQAEIDKIKISVKAPTVEQVENSSKAATWAAGTGFAAVALFMKLLINFSPLGVDASHFVNIAGPLILLIAELLAGKYKAQGPGFSAVDSDAYQKWDQLNARMHRLNAQVQGMAANPGTPQEELDEAKRRFTEMRIGQQKAVFDCLTRELGHDTGLKRDDHLPDVPKDTLLACLNSKLTGDKATGEVRLPDGAPLFLVLNDKGDVQWPSGACTNLLKEPIPTEHVQTFEAAAKLLIEAARCRSFICDDVPFHLFGIPFLWNALGPFLLATHPQGELAAKIGDTLLMVASSVVGTYMVLNMQNWLRGRYTGAGTSVGLHNAASPAKHEKAKFEEQALKARLEQGLSIVSSFKADVAESKREVKAAKALVKTLTSELNTLADETTAPKWKLQQEIQKKFEQLQMAESAFRKAGEHGPNYHITIWVRAQEIRDQLNSELIGLEDELDALETSTAEKVDVIHGKLLAATENLKGLRDERNLHIEFLAKADRLCGAIVKDLAAAQRKVTSTGRKAGVTAILIADVYEGYKEDPIRLIAKLIAYTLCYTAFGGMYTPIAAHVVTSLSGKMAMAAFGGSFMSLIFMFRNIKVTPGLQYTFHGLLGQLEKLYATYKGYPSNSVSEVPPVLGDVRVDDDTLAEARLRLSHAWDQWANAYGNQLKPDDARLLGRILGDLPNLGNIDEVLANLDVGELAGLAAATDLVLTGWGEWGAVFEREQSTMHAALEAINTWARITGQVED